MTLSAFIIVSNRANIGLPDLIYTLVVFNCIIIYVDLSDFASIDTMSVLAPLGFKVKP